MAHSFAFAFPSSRPTASLKGVLIDTGLQRDKIFPDKVVSDKDLPTVEARVLGYLVLFLEPLEVLSQEVGVELGQE
jgi:hypothetical protein